MQSHISHKAESLGRLGDRWRSEHLCGILPRSDVAEVANSGGDLEECESVKSINTDDLWHV